MDDFRNCQHEDEHSWWEHDAQGIPLCRVCDKCRKGKLSTYRPEILSGYTQADIDEDIEPDYGCGEGHWTEEDVY